MIRCKVVVEWTWRTLSVRFHNIELLFTVLAVVLVTWHDEASCPFLSLD